MVSLAVTSWSLGNVLANGEDHRPHEVQAMMEQLRAEYVHANPRHLRGAQLD
jgi:hypothetical protein